MTNVLDSDAILFDVSAMHVAMLKEDRAHPTPVTVLGVFIVSLEQSQCS
jgi:hypothetical protein